MRMLTGSGNDDEFVSCFLPANPSACPPAGGGGTSNARRMSVIGSSAGRRSLGRGRCVAQHTLAWVREVEEHRGREAERLMDRPVRAGRERAWGGARLPTGEQHLRCDCPLTRAPVLRTLLRPTGAPPTRSDGTTSAGAAGWPKRAAGWIRCGGAEGGRRQ